MTPFFNYYIRTDLPERLPKEQIVINTLNPHSYCVAKKDDLFSEALQASDILIPDGIGIVWGVRKLQGIQIKKIAGYDLHLHSLKLLERQQGGKIFYLGASEDTLKKIKQRVAKEYPGVEVGYYSPPYKSSFSTEDNDTMLKQVNAFKPDILCVGMTAPKQEKWVHQFKNKLDVNIVCSIGAVFDFYAGTVKRPSEFWIKLGLEWLPRLLKQPRKLFERNFISTPKFIFYVLLAKMKKSNST